MENNKNSVHVAQLLIKLQIMWIFLCSTHLFTNEDHITKLCMRVTPHVHVHTYYMCILILVCSMYEATGTVLLLDLWL